MICLTGPKNKEKKNEEKKQREQTTLTFRIPPEPLINVQPFEIAKDSWETHRIGQKKRRRSSFLIYCILYTVHYSSCSVIAAISRYTMFFCVACCAAISNTSSLITKRTVCPPVTVQRCSAWAMNVHVICIMFGCRGVFVEIRAERR